ncbi:MAG: putative selenium-dependent hydroxylase accessory protein YqeC [Anaerolineae bacterium]|nr:putative selenium-dependent hydroxylase accessory protein YqeC [Anaerolineae bacterium]
MDLQRVPSEQPIGRLSLSQALRLGQSEVVALVGGGGKTTTLFRLAAELAATRRVLMTTSTRIFAAQIQQAPAYVTFDPNRQTLDDILPVLHNALDRHSQVLLIGQIDRPGGKAFGIAPEVIDALVTTGQFDTILVEADGSRMRPFKAPADHEPVIPALTTIVVPVVGIDILGRPLTDESAHRAGRVSQLSHTPLGEPVTSQTITEVFCHRQGGLKNVPDGARFVPLINKVETTAQQRAAHDLAARLLACERVDSVVIGAVQAKTAPILDIWGRSAAVILAAGGSTRFGSPKQLAPWRDKTFIEHVVDTTLASAANPVIVVLGAEVEQCRRLLQHKSVTIVINDRWADGQSTSMQAGLAALPANVSSALFLLVDLPGVTADVLNAIIDRHRQTLAPLVWPEFAGRRGNPVLFDRALFAELSHISGDTGGRPVLLAHKDQAERVIVAQPGIIQDVDRPEDLEEL